MSDDLNDLYGEMIMDHNHSPRNFRVMADANHRVEGHNPLCGDRVTVFLKTEGGVIKDVSFQGSGCAISKSSASVMTTVLKDKTVADARTIFDEFRRLIIDGQGDTARLGKLATFSGVHKFPARVKCAILPWHAVSSALEGRDTPVSTENDPPAL
jgi:nitrogen fixation NifU-like protein